jgi:Icc protein
LTISITTIDDDVMAWKFKEFGPWPFVMITSPADEKLITRPDSAHHVIRDTIAIRAKVWDGEDASSLSVTCSIDRGPVCSMTCAKGVWQCDWNSREVIGGTHQISVRAIHDEREAWDEISVLVNQAGRYTPPTRSTIDYENAIGAYPDQMHTRHATWSQ